MSVDCFFSCSCVRQATYPETCSQPRSKTSPTICLHSSQLCPRRRRRARGVPRQSNSPNFSLNVELSSHKQASWGQSDWWQLQIMRVQSLAVLPTLGSRRAAETSSWQPFAWKRLAHPETPVPSPHEKKTNGNLRIYTIQLQDGNCTWEADVTSRGELDPRVQACGLPAHPPPPSPPSLLYSSKLPPVRPLLLLADNPDFYLPL
ncbi:uncharacterized protein LOC112560705 [Pomacea canaliculata]|uniref:uncharacterized protein LOC112560705 n=1 Tax=Pomacea canaliculata TaxID=400727 RepID=UPI000D72A757|nr:uncharacterized protein LOC112560705 [Pomacea canaliculata]